MRWVVSIISAIALLLALAVFAAGPGTRLGFWDYGFGLTLIREASAPKAIASGISLSPLFTAIGLSFIGAIIAAMTRQKRAALLAIAVRG